MPSFAPRSEAIKKQEQLVKSEIELRHAIYNNYSDKKLDKAANNYRDSQLSLLKAQIHVIKDKAFQNKPITSKIDNLEAKIEMWRARSVEEILNSFK